MNIEVLKTGVQSILIKLDDESRMLISNPDGTIDRLTARCLASKVLDISAIEYSALNFVLEAFLGNGGCLLFASGHKQPCDELFCFEHINTVAHAAEFLPDDLDAALYFFDNKFYLLVRKCPENVVPTLEEYGKHIDNGLSFLSSISPCCKIIISEDTVKQLRRFY